VTLDPTIAFHEITVATLGAYANYTYPLYDPLYLKLKLGMVNVDYRWDYGTGHTHDRDENQWHLAKGVGITYSINPTLRTNVEYIFLDNDDLKALNLSLEKRF